MKDKIVLGHHETLVEFIRKLGLDPDLTRRVIVDIPCDNVVKVYVEGYADKAAFQIDPSPLIQGEGGYRVYLSNGDGSPIDVTTHKVEP